MKTRHRSLVDQLIHTLQITENALLMGLAVVVGTTTGFSVWLFRQAFAEFEHIFFDELPNIVPLHDFSPPLFLMLTGLLIGWLMDRVVGHERHHGVAAIIESVALVGGRLPYKKGPAKAFASALSIGAGASVGPEDPSVQIGANLGSFFGQWLHLSEERVRLLVAAGAASAISAAFNAPIAGVFFALEVILADFATGAVGVVVLAAVMSSVVTLSIAGNDPSLGIHIYKLGGPEQVPFYILLGLIAAPVSVLFMRAVYWQHDMWHELALPRPIKTALAGLIVGCFGVFFPQIMGTGHHTLDEVLNTGKENFTVQLLLALVVLKIGMTSVSMAGGFVGGIFAPALFVGAMLGGAYGRIIERIPSIHIGNPSAYAIAGMAGVMAGVVRAPITAILLIFELTNDYQLIVPIMLTTVVCVYVSERYEDSGIYAYGLKRQGFYLQQGRDIDVMQSILVEEVMRQAAVIDENSTLSELRDAFRDCHCQAICVVDKKFELTGIVTLTDLQTAYETVQQVPSNLKSGMQLKVRDIASRNLITISPQEPVWTAIRRMGQHSFQALPVVAPDNDRKLVGILRRSDVMRGYSIAINRKWESQYKQNQIRLSNLIDEKVLELQVAPNSAVANKTLREIDWGHDSVVASVRRGQRVILPHGTTMLYAGDEVTIIAIEEAQEKIRQMVEVSIQDSDQDSETS